jgi:DNA polymerase I-like protein with 3'-5' exonuclease and polymerase domains
VGHPSYLPAQYLASPDEWRALAARMHRARVVGLDTEFYGLDVRKQSTVGLARVHVWSVAIRLRSASPLGFHHCAGFVLPAAALQDPSLRAVLEDPTITKCVHNQSVDDHAIHNHGVDLRGCVNTLNLARWAWPGHVSYRLKPLMQSRLHREPICEYADVVGDTRTVAVTRTRNRKITVCSCGTPGCRLRKGHERRREVVTEEITTYESFEIPLPLQTIVPGHPRWELLVRYAAEDAVAAVQVWELCRLERDPAPFPYADSGRPSFCQEAEDAVVAMERVGIPIDVEWCTAQLATARADEAAQLERMRRWLPAAEMRLSTDKVWSSPQRLVALFDSLGFPRSPVWAKGRVKPGDPPKTDATALSWIAQHHRPAREVVAEVLHLKRIRAAIKYLVRMSESGGLVYPVCGPAGDADRRVGAVTGRLAVKGQLASQQLPARKEVDLYHVRRGIVAR